MSYNRESFLQFINDTLSQRPHIKTDEKPFDNQGIAEIHRKQAAERIQHLSTMMRRSGNKEEVQKVMRSRKRGVI